MHEYNLEDLVVPDAPIGFSDPLGWLSRNDPRTFDLIDMVGGVDQDISTLTSMCEAQGVRPIPAKASKALIEAGVETVLLFPEWILMAYYAE